jgi:hypothetical protein
LEAPTQDVEIRLRRRKANTNIDINMKTETTLHPAVRIVGDKIVITEDNVTLTPDEAANILIEMDRQGIGIGEEVRSLGILPFEPKRQ